MEYALSLGSNLGNRLANLSAAKNAVLQKTDAMDLKQSSVYETEPVGVRPEYRHLKYLNAVVVLQTKKEPKEVSSVIHAIEDEMGRIRTEDRFAPRPIDIDILYAGETLSDTTELTLPHPRWAERAFVVQPLADIRSQLILPGYTQTVADILSTLPDRDSVKLFTKDW